MYFVVSIYSRYVYTMSAITVYSLAFTFVCAASGIGVDSEKPVTVQRIYAEKKLKHDLESQATGYIFRSDGNNPPIYIKLGSGNIDQYNEISKKTGLSSPGFATSEADKLDSGELNVPAKSSYRSVKSDYTDINLPSKSSYASVKSEYTDINIPAKHTHSPLITPHRSTYTDTSDILREVPYTKPSYASDDSHKDSIFKEAFKLVKLGQGETVLELPKAQPEFKNLKGIASIPSSQDGYDDADFEQPTTNAHYDKSNSHYEQDDEVYDISAYDKVNVPGKAYIAPIFNVPRSDEVVFNQQKPPVKYNWHPKAVHPTYGGHADSYEEQPAENSGEKGEHEDEPYLAHYTADYHHKPKKYHFKKGAGETYKNEYHSSYGKKGDKGHKKYHDFDEGEMGNHGTEGHKGFYDNENGNKKSHYNEGDKYGEVHGKLHGEKGVKYGESEGHKKGHKTSGYHNIFHKDEFKKEHKFYDDIHNHGHKDKHGGYHTDHGKKHGHKASGDFYDSAYDYGHKGNSGHHKKGHFDQDHKGYKGASGHEAHFIDQADYGKKEGNENSKHFGFEQRH